VRAYYDWIYLSPHLDDVALSCGGQIARQTQSGQTVLIVSVMAGDPPGESGESGTSEAVSVYARSLHERWAAAERDSGGAAAMRRAEDLEACRILGADPLHWPVPDCIYRRHPLTGIPFYNSDAELFGPVAAEEQELARTIAQELVTLPDHGRLVIPLTVGHHVDHQLVRAAAEQAFGPSGGLLYYEDYPYAQQPGAVAAVVGDPPAGWQAEVIPLNAAALRAKLDAVAAFHSQLSTFFRDHADLEAQISGFAAATGGERLWRKTEPG
jgi:LmbE family N-acetylglucosaminyl deacetylase